MKLYILIIFLNIIAFSQQKTETLFKKLSPNESGVEFINKVTQNEILNLFTVEYMYNGSGVGVGDFNNDGLADIIFGGNQENARLYLNKGNMKFEDITKKSKLDSKGKWISGVTVVDINGDGFLDIYFSISLLGYPTNTINQLWINNGNLTFTDKAKEYGLDLPYLTTQSTFFDADNDSDLDMYMITTQGWTADSISEAIKPNTNLETFNDGLYINNNGKFERSNLIKVKDEYFGLGIVASDLDNNGFVDLYVSNDYTSQDFLLFNDSTKWVESIKKSTKQISNNSMGLDANDFDNDGYVDIITLDMTAADNKRLKSNMSAMNPQKFWWNIANGGHYEYMFNAFQRNNGNRLFNNIAFISNVATTDWSWAPLLADFNNDGWKDLFITNGIRYDFRNTDYQKVYMSMKEAIKVKNNLKRNNIKDSILESQTILNNKVSMEKYNIHSFDDIKIDMLIKDTPATPLPNYAFKNNGTLRFEDVSEDWGLNDLGYSQGAAYADFDNDGDLDLAVNNVDDYSFIYENKSELLLKNNYIRFDFKGPGKNIFGLNTKVNIWVDGKFQTNELTLTRGFASSVEPVLHFGIEKYSKVDSAEIIWLGGKSQKLYNLSINKKHTISYKDANLVHSYELPKSKYFIKNTEFKPPLNYSETEFDDYEREILIPHKMSQLGGGVAIADFNNNGSNDIYFPASKGKIGTIYKFSNLNEFKEFENRAFTFDSVYEDMGSLFFDANGDNLLDLYVCSGGNQYEEGSPFYQDRLYIYNEKSKSFDKKPKSLPQMFTSTSCVVSADYDKDGDLDLFVGGRQTPGKYPYPTNSYILRNDNEVFVNVTNEVAPELVKPGMVTSALWTDFDNDDDKDLIVAGEWMSIMFFENQNGKLKDITDEEFKKNNVGWWWSINGGDFDNDGDIDYVVGNLGLNYKYQATIEEPFSVYSKDFDGNGHNDIVLSYYDVDGKIYPLRGRSCSSQQIPDIKKQFPSYNLFSEATLTDVYKEQDLKDALQYDARQFGSVYIENKGNKKFEVKLLPDLAQVSTIFGILPFDFDGDTNLDLLLTGNFYHSEIETPRADASIGLLVLGDGKGNFKPVDANETGIMADNDAKGLAFIKNGPFNLSAIVVNNNSPAQVFDVNTEHISIFQNVSNNIDYSISYLKNGKIRKEEYYFGSGYLSQSSRFYPIYNYIKSFEFIDRNSKKERFNIDEK